MKESKYYTTPDHHDYLDDDGFPRVSVDSNKVFAKAVKEVKGKNVLERSPSYFKYYVRVEPNKALHDPLTKYSFQAPRSSFVDKICKSENTFMEVNQSIFYKYINYLKTQNSQWLVDAQREAR